MKATCTICGKIGIGTRDQLIRWGWAGYNLRGRAQRQFCPVHSEAETIVRFIKRDKNVDKRTT